MSEAHEGSMTDKPLAEVVKELRALIAKGGPYGMLSVMLPISTVERLLDAAERAEGMERALREIAVRKEGTGLARTFVNIARAALAQGEGRTVDNNAEGR